MDNENILGRIVDYIGGLIRGNASAANGSNLSGLTLPDSVTRNEFGEIVALLKGFLSSGEIQTVTVETRNLLSATVVEAEKTGFEQGWGKLKTLISDTRANEVVQPLLAFAFKHQDEFASVLKIFAGDR
ncbi:MAG: hypothetical protein LBH66_04250 [Oscillospiraceae bacterium]|jgi:hypothetical protein|nr:hypothetical protein [Oscillospiraceae bacterium]